MEYVLIPVAALLVSGLTFYSGFGLGTMLMPVFALFFPVDVAVAATAVVHGANNVFKITVAGKFADRSLIIRFGIPAIVAAMAGAAALGYVSNLGEIASYTVGSRTAVITPVKLAVAVMMLVFALFELLPKLRELRVDRKYLPAGGLLSGFFGGFSGHQGALRATFLTKTGISTQSFVGTNAAIGFMVDLTRISVYALMFLAGGKDSPFQAGEWPLIIAGTIAAFAGVMIGKKFLHKVTMKTVQTLTGILLIGIALALGSGII